MLEENFDNDENLNLDKKAIIDMLFLENPKLLLTGSKEDYIEYLENIFPKTKIKNIVFHCSDAFDIEKEGFVQDLSKKFPHKGEHEKIGSFFSKNLFYAKEHGENLYFCLLNIKNPKYVKDLNRPNSIKAIKEIKKFRQKLKNFLFLKESPDGFYGNDNGTNEEVYVALEKEQIHILGSRNDIFNFSNFLLNKN